MPELELYEIRSLIAAGVEIGMKRILAEVGVIKPFLSKSEAYRLYGKETIERWISEGLLKVQKDGDRTAKVRIRRMDLEILATSSNRTTYLPTNER